MSIPVFGDGDKQKEEQKRVERMAQGEVPGFKSSRYTQEDKSQLQQNTQKMASKANDKEKGTFWTSGLIYALAAQRDAPYSAAGRLYMRKLSLNSRMRAAYARALIFKSIESAVE